MNNSEYLQLIKDIINIDNIDGLVNHTIEKTTGVKIYNKNELLKEIVSKNITDVDQISNIIARNMLMQIKFETVFKSDLGFSLIFNNNKPIVIYRNKRVALTDLENIRKDILESNFIIMPKNNKLFVDTLFIIIEKIINMDWSVTYYCIDWIQPWSSLFENKCYKHDKDMKLKLNSYSYMDDIMSGKLYKTIEEEKYDEEFIKEIIDKDDEKKNNDTMQRMEVMAYLNDNEVSYFLETLEQFDNMNYDALGETKVLNQLLGFTSNADNKIIRFYFINKLFQYIMTIKDFLVKHTNLSIQVNKKLDDITDDLYIIQSAGLNLSFELTSTLIEAKEFMNQIKN